MTFVGSEVEGRGEDQDWLLPEIYIAHLTAVSTMLLPFVCLSFYLSSCFSLCFVTPWLLIKQKDTPFLWTVLGCFPFNKSSGLKFQTFHVPNATTRPDPTRPDPTQATARLVIILVSRIQKSVTEDNNFAPNQIFLSDRNEKVRSIWFLTKTSKILGCINGKRPYWIYEPGQRC